MKKEKIEFFSTRGIITLEKEGKDLSFNGKNLKKEQALECLWMLLKMAAEKLNPSEQEDRSSELRELGIKADLQATAAAVADSEISESEVESLIKRRINTWQ